MGRANNEYLNEIASDLPGYMVFYVASTGNKSYDDTDITEDAYHILIQNTGASNLTFEINSDSNVYTVLAGKESLEFKYREPITAVDITATDTFTLLIRQ